MRKIRRRRRRTRKRYRGGGIFGNVANFFKRGTSKVTSGAKGFFGKLFKRREPDPSGSSGSSYSIPTAFLRHS